MLLDQQAKAVTEAGLAAMVPVASGVGAGGSYPLSGRRSLGRVQVLSASDPQMVTIETSSEIADELRQKLAKTHFVEPEVRRGLDEA